MKAKITILIIFIYLITGSIHGRNWNKILKEIKEEQLFAVSKYFIEKNILAIPKGLNKVHVSAILKDTIGNKNLRTYGSYGEQEEKYINSYYNLRGKSRYLKAFSPIIQNDTIFIIDSFGGWTSPILLSIAWNSTDTIYCISDDIGKSYMFKKNNFYTNQIMKLVSVWDIDGIKKEAKINGSMSNNDMNCATRIIFNGKKYHIDCILFRDFFNTKRDGADFNH